MSANDLLEKVKALPLRERRKFFAGVHHLEEQLTAPKSLGARRTVRWPHSTARRRRIFGNKVLPNLVLLARNDERY
jgi:hypothetical protein